MTATKRPRREKKFDRLLHPRVSAAELECDYSIAPLDRLALDMDRKWGVDRLPELVSVETAARYGKAIAHLNDCINATDPAKTAAAAQNCIKGLNVMDAEATAAGKPEASGEYLEYDLDGFKFGVMLDGREWPAIVAARPDLTFYNLREVALALKAYARSVPIAEVKAAFPGAEVTKLPQTELEKDLDDVIPF